MATRPGDEATWPWFLEASWPEPLLTSRSVLVGVEAVVPGRRGRNPSGVEAGVGAIIPLGVEAGMQLGVGAIRRRGQF